MTIASALRQLLSFDDETARCTPVTVKGGPSFCIQGPVCGSELAKGQAKGSGMCPRRNDKADSNCDSKAQHLSSSCTALVDAKCMDLGGDKWECVFPIDGPGYQTVEQIAPYTQDQIPSSPMSDQAVKLSAPALESHTASNTLGASNASINIAVGVACCVLAFVGLVFVKKRRNRERSSSYTLSEKDISIVTL